MARQRLELQFDDATLLFKNFRGEKGMYDKEGKRTFSVIIPDENVARQMETDGWNVKWPKPRDDIDPEEDDRSPRIQVEARFDNFPPNIWLITSTGRTRVKEKSVETLDWMDMAKVDLIVNGSRWRDDDGSERIKAYLKTMFITLDEDALELRYAQVPVKGEAQEDED